MRTSDPKKIVEHLIHVTEENAVDMTLMIHEGLVRSTPVDTGWAASNWLPSVGKPIEGAAGSRQNVSTEAQERGVREIASWKLEKGPIFIVNNVPYIGDLNNGHSKQAPAGFIEIEIQSAVDKINRRELE